MSRRQSAPRRRMRDQPKKLRDDGSPAAAWPRCVARVGSMSGRGTGRPVEVAALPSKPTSIYEDRTLRRGDAVMTDKGLRIFDGSRSFPYLPSDFVDLDKSRAVPKSIRKSLNAYNQQTPQAVVVAVASAPAMTVHLRPTCWRAERSRCARARRERSPSGATCRDGQARRIHAGEQRQPASIQTVGSSKGSKLDRSRAHHAGASTATLSYGGRAP